MARRRKVFAAARARRARDKAAHAARSAGTRTSRAERGSDHRRHEKSPLRQARIDGQQRRESVRRKGFVKHYFHDFKKRLAAEASVKGNCRVRVENLAAADVEKVAQESRKKVGFVDKRQFKSLNLGRQPVTADFPARCDFCGGLSFKDENATLFKCCENGKVQLPPLQPFPKPLQDLFTVKRFTGDGKDFHNNIRRYNGLYAMASTRIPQADDLPLKHWGGGVVRICGQVYHRTGPLHPAPNTDPLYNQLYIFDGSEALAQRKNCKLYDVNFSNNVMKIIQGAMDLNPYAGSYKNMRQVEMAENEEARREGREPQEVKMFFKQPTSSLRTKNKPTHEEVAAVFKSSDGAAPQREYVIESKSDGNLTFLNELTGIVDPLSYPLLFPGGDLGYDLYEEVRHVGPRATAIRNRLTLREFYNYRLAIRDEEFNPILQSGQLLQQYCVDAYCKVEANRLKFVRTHQTDMRVDRFDTLRKYVDKKTAEVQAGYTGTDKPPAAGTPMFLPTNFEGSERCYSMRYKDAMAVSSKYGKPDLFITMTCNPAWPEIVDNLKPGQTALNAPHLTSRVFNLYKSKLLRELWDDGILGKCDTHISVIEFQKRGLPHCHILIHLNHAHKLRTGTDIDTVICAEMPDKATHPLLWDTVFKSMVHGPCGDLNPSNVCMVRKDDAVVCGKKFPKEWCEETKVIANCSYPHYRRRANIRTECERRVRGRGPFMVTNRWVVPYNPYLSQRYNCHINVESCQHIKAIKYLYKYIYKGVDQGSIRFVPATGKLQYDEVSTYLEGRYLSAPEACWKMFAFPMHDNSHSVERLQVHLPDKQPVVFADGAESDAIEDIHHTTLTAFFDLNTSIVPCSRVRYCDVIDTFRFQKGSWQRRKYHLRKPIVARMHYASPRDVERYHLRLLLLNVVGPTSFEDLRTVDGFLHPSFKSACQALNLISDNSHAVDTMRELLRWASPCQARRNFAFLLVFAEVSDARELWESFKVGLSDDFVRHGHSRESALNSALDRIYGFLRKHISDETISGHNLPPLNDRLTVAPESAVRAEARADIEQLGKSLNDAQRLAASNILKEIADYESEQQPKARTFFLDGPGGTGKTYLYNYLVSVCKSRGIAFSCSAWAGIAATLLENGRTCHSAFGLPVPCDEGAKSRFSPSSTQGELLRATILFIVDEVSMMNKHALEAIDRMLRDVCGNSAPFGGKIMLFGGDFRQTLTIVPRGSPDQIIAASVVSSPLWKLNTRFSLSVNMRARAGEIEFAKYLLDMGSNLLPRKSSDPFQSAVEIPSQCIVEGDLSSKIFPAGLSPNEMHSRAILTLTNESSLIVNERILARIPGTDFTVLSNDSVVSDDAQGGHDDQYPIDFVNGVTPNGLPPHALHLKPDCVVMLLKNVDVESGLVNGTRLIVRHIRRHTLDVEILSGVHRGERHFLPMMLFDTSDANLPFRLRRFTFPIRLAYSMTINKSQGQTFEKIGLHLDRCCFGHGQLYVGYSRARALRDVHVSIRPTCGQGKVDGLWYTQNIIYPTVLEMCRNLKTVTSAAVVPSRFLSPTSAVEGEAMGSSQGNAIDAIGTVTEMDDVFNSPFGTALSWCAGVGSEAAADDSIDMVLEGDFYDGVEDNGHGFGNESDDGHDQRCDGSSALDVPTGSHDLPLVRAVVGLHNMANTCYSNAILQMLRAVPVLWSERRYGPTALTHAFVNVMRVLREESGTHYPAAYNRALDDLADFDVSSQQDAGEVLLFLLDEFCGEDFFDARQFTISVSSETRCSACATVSRRDSSSYIWQVSSMESVQSAIRTSFEPTHLSGANQFQCHRCQRKVDAETRHVLMHCPDVLFVQLSRFDIFMGRAIKLNNPVVVNDEVTLGSFTYNLQAVLSHEGSIERGHYWAHVKVEDDWWKCNDTVVSASSQRAIGEKEVYILAYAK